MAEVEHGDAVGEMVDHCTWGPIPHLVSFYREGTGIEKNSMKACEILENTLKDTFLNPRETQAVALELVRVYIRGEGEVQNFDRAQELLETVSEQYVATMFSSEDYEYIKNNEYCIDVEKTKLNLKRIMEEEKKKKEENNHNQN